MITNLKFIIISINKVWLNLKLQTQLILTAGAVISFSIGSFMSWTILEIQDANSINDRRIVRDVSSLIGANVVSLINEKTQEGILPFFGRFYQNSPTIRYIIFFSQPDNVYYGLPFSYKDASDYKLLPNINQDRVKTSLLYSSKTLQNQSIKLNLISEGKFLGTLIVGITSNSTLINNSRLTIGIIAIVFIGFWIFLILGAVFNAFTIVKPIKELSVGVKNIADGNFRQRIELPFGGEFGNLILNFNEMGRRLQKFEENNVEQVMDEKTKLENLVSTIADGAVLLDNNLNIILINEAALNLLGLRKTIPLIRTPLWKHLPVDIQKKMFLALQQTINSQTSSIFYAEINNLIQSENATKSSICVILKLVYNYKNSFTRLTGITLTIQDNTRELQLDKTRNQFMSNVSHELRTPLFNIKSFIETTKEYKYTLSNNQKNDFLETVNKETDRLTKLVNEILNLSRLESGYKYVFEGVNLNKIIQQIIRNYQFIAQDRAILVETNLNQSLPLVYGNSNLLLQVLINLIGNALKFTHKDGAIIIQAYEIGSKVRIEIIDSGIGISFRSKKKIFNRFVRDENEVHPLKGTGLGLSIVDTILQNHNSTINVSSKKDVGSVFWFDLMKN